MNDKSLYSVDKDDADQGAKNKALDTALTQIERSFGKGSIMKLGADGVVVEIESIFSIY